MVMVKANLWTRLAALLVDLALVVPLYYAAVFLFARATGRTWAQMWDTAPVLLSAGIANVLWLFYTSTEWLWGATPGKALLGMRILARDGAKADRGALVIRWAMKWSVRIFGLLDATAALARPRLLLAKGGLIVFYHEPANFALARYLGEICLFVILGGMLLALRPDGRSLHDLATGTSVYRKKLMPAKRGFEMMASPQEPRAVVPVGED